MIKRRTMGRTGLHLSELCLGTLNFGWKTDEKTSFAILDAYRAAGGNFIQASSHSPGLLLPSLSASASERVVGRWWRSRGIPRGDLVFATRIHVSPPGTGDASLAAFVRQACRESMRRFQTSYLDIVIFEWTDGAVAIREMLEACDHVIRGGLARFIGAANFPPWRVADALGRAYLKNHNRMEALQADYSLLTRARFEPEAMALCREQRLGFFARAPLAGGFLARGGREDAFGAARRGWLAERFANAYGAAALAAASDVAARHEASSAQVALAWVLHNAVVTSAVIGVRSAAQLDELAEAGRLRLTAGDLDQLGAATAAEEIRVAPENASGMPGPEAFVLN